MTSGRTLSVAALTLSAAFSLVQSATVAYSADGDKPAAVTRGTCETSKIKFVTDSTNQSTTSNVFTLLTDSDTSIKIKGDEPGCVIVTFSAQGLARAATSQRMNVQAVLDNVTVADPGEVQFIAQSDTLSDTHAMTFVFPSVAPGQHTVQIYFRSGVNGQSSAMNKWTLTVQF